MFFRPSNFILSSIILSTTILSTTFSYAENLSQTELAATLIPVYGIILSDDKRKIYAESNLPTTGQTTVYKPYDDGYYRIGKDDNYTRDNAQKIVTDNITGLQWMDDIYVKTIPFTFAGANTYCTQLAIGGGGWRVPNMDELSSILREGKYYPAMHSIFKNIALFDGEEGRNLYYWSNVNYIQGEAAWVIDFKKALITTNAKSETISAYVRCVK